MPNEVGHLEVIAIPVDLMSLARVQTAKGRPVTLILFGADYAIGSTIAVKTAPDSRVVELLIKMGMYY